MEMFLSFHMLFCKEALVILFPHDSFCSPTAIVNPKQPKEVPKSFNFDYSYWSHTTVGSSACCTTGREADSDAPRLHHCHCKSRRCFQMFPLFTEAGIHASCYLLVAKQLNSHQNLHLQGVHLQIRMSSLFSYPPFRLAS